MFLSLYSFTYHPQPNLRINHNKQLLQPFAKLFLFLTRTLYLLLNCETLYLQILLPVQNLSSFKGVRSVP